jgi:hypothetical protein
LEVASAPSASYEDHWTWESANTHLGTTERYCPSVCVDDMKIVLSLKRYSIISSVRTDGVLAIIDGHVQSDQLRRLGANAELGS